ncbi:MAG: glutathione S-transferase family protein [Rhodobacteraceae bacterium]|nr:glutathione S-transferase family protein [Paracoccaceae bacterium]MBC7157554.1 glutathione S-transferase family protein [Paracoccaceae bacterium]
MLTLYSDPVSLYCAKVRVALRAKRVPYEALPPPGGYGSAVYRAMVPAGNLPALDHDGLLIADSEAIVEYVDEVFDGPALLPATPALRARMRARGRFHDTRFEPEVRVLFGQVAPTTRDAAHVAARGEALQARLEQFAQALAGDPPMAFGAGDCGWPVSFWWLDRIAPVVGIALDWPEAVRAYRARIEAEPAVAAEYADYAPAMDGWMAIKLAAG